MSIAEIQNKPEQEHELKTTIPMVEWYSNISAWKSNRQEVYHLGKKKKSGKK